MEAVILAAGEGSRMGELTNDQPKLLLDVAGKTILEWQLDAIEPFCDEVTVVVGHGFESGVQEQIRSLAEGYDVPLRIVRFDDWAEYENAATCYHGLEGISDDVLLLCGDVVFSREVLSQIVDEYETRLEPESYSAVAAVEGLQDEMTGILWDDEGTVVDYGAIESHREIGVFILHRSRIEEAREILSENFSEWFPIIFPRVPTKFISVPESEQFEMNRPADLEVARRQLPFREGTTSAQTRGESGTASGHET